MPARTRKRWAIAGCVAAAWVLMLAVTRSVVAGTAMLLLAAAFAIGTLLALRCLGIDRHHPWVQRAATRPWRDGRDVLQLALRHLPEVFVITPSGSLLAPNLVELRMNPADVASVTEVMELEVINASASELYESKVAAHAARLGSAGPVQVSVVADPEVPAGRYRLKHGRRGVAGPAAGDGAGSFPAPRGSGWDRSGPGGSGWGRDPRGRDDRPIVPTLVRDVLTVEAPSQPVPLLRLVTNDSVAETHVSGARAGRGSGVELPLPDEPTVSRVHAEFTFTGGEWRIVNLGRNGILVNERPVGRGQVIHDGDLITWGPHPGALESRVEVG
jgi:FHA domain